jgi:WD40 repeat protein
MITRITLTLVFTAGLTMSGYAQPTARDIVRDPGGATAPDAPKLVLETGGFTSAVLTLDFSRDGRYLAAGGIDKAVRIWELATGQLRATLRGEDGVATIGTPRALAFSPDGRELVVGITNIGGEGSIRVYQLQDLSRIAQTLSCHPQEGTRHVTFSTDGRYLASAGADGEIIIWDWPARRALHRIHSPRALRYIGFPMRLPYLMTQDLNAANRLWSATNGRDLSTLSPQEKQALVQSLGGEAVVTGMVQEIAHRVAQFRSPRPPFGGEGTIIQLYLDSGHIVSGGKGTKDGLDHYYVGVWQAENGNQPVRVYEDHTYIPTAVALSPDRSLVASGDFLGEIHVWEVATGQRRLKVLTGDGHAYYKVAFDASGRRLAFGSAPHTGKAWNYNHYADPERTFELERRRIVDGYSGQLQTELTRKGDMELKAVRSGNSVGLAWYRSGQLVNSYAFETMPLCFSILRSDRPGFADPVVFGELSLMVKCADPYSIKARRVFIGHQGPVYSLSESPDGRFLATASTDRTIRLWSLERFAIVGKPDFELTNDGLIRVVPAGSSAQAAGIQIGDRLLAINGLSVASMLDRIANRRWDLQPGQKVPVEIERNGQRYQVEVTLTAGSDLADPLLSLFIANDGEWVLWTPQGYYDASLGGDRLIGWHVNQGPTRAAKFYLAHQFRKQFYRPDIIDKILQLGDVPRAVAQANAEQPHPTESLDLRNPDHLRRQEPPRVRLLAPIDGTRTSSQSIEVRAEVRSQNDLPVSEVTILVNGRPAWSKNIERAQNADDSQPMVIERQVQLLPGENTIAVVASNAASNSHPTPITVVSETLAPIARPSLYILAVGISEYAQPELNLRFAHRDAEEFAAAWKTQEGPVYAKVETRVLTNKEATVRGILDGMEWLVHSATQKDVAILFLSAHGVRDERDNYYLATHEIDLKRLRSTAVRWNEVESLIQDIPSKFLLFVDTCHSAGITGAKGARGVDPLRELVSEDTGAIVLSSSMAREVSLEDPRWGHGAFTKALLDIFRGGADGDHNKDGYLSLTELNDELAERVKALTEGRQHTATKWPPTISNFNFYRLDTAAR